MKRQPERIAELEKSILPQPAPVILINEGDQLPEVRKNVIVIIDDIK